MNESIEKQLQRYLTMIFANVPKSRKATELKQELFANLLERYENYVQDGKSSEEAYKLTVESIGNTDELLSSVTPDENLQNKIDSYKKMKARNIAISVALYFIAAAVLIGFSTFSEILGKDEDMGAIIGLISLLVICAVATAIIIYTNISIPKEVEPYVKDVENNSPDRSTKRGKLYASILELFWLLVTVLYLGISFLTGAWHITWLIWIIAAIIEKAIKLFYIGREEEDNE
ncbi:MAG: hypothetical protein J5505_01590 [Spirochaetaceae bacterium]|nr:hypothetical protein [Spirochaetaceae bacterium]